MKPHIVRMGRRWYVKTCRDGLFLFGSVFRHEAYEWASALWSTRKLFISEVGK